MAGLELFHDVGRDGAAELGAALDGQAIDDAELDLAGLDLVGQQGLQDVLGHAGDHGADAVTAAYADDDLVKLGIIYKVALVLHGLDARELALDDFFKLLTGLFG